MSTAVALTDAFESRWILLNGPMKGSARQLQVATFNIGRSADCEIALLYDLKCSRRHAAIEHKDDGWRIKSLVEAQPVLVNGRAVQKVVLNSGDIVTIGETQIRFEAGNPLHVVSPKPYHLNAAPAANRPQPQRPRRNPKAPANSNRFIIYGVVGLLLYWLLNPTAKKDEQIKIRTEQQTQADIETAAKLKEAAEVSLREKFDPSLAGRQAQENYVRGFRDYREGQFERSLTSFQACLALNPKHVLCNRYYRLAQRKFNELVQYHVVLGRQYRDQKQYKACRTAFKNVMVMVKDQNSATYKEAKANYEACNTLVEGRF